MKTQLEEGFYLLGLHVRDRVTGFGGVVTSISFDLYGCVQALLHPGLDEKGAMAQQVWFDLGRLSVTDSKPVMDVPDFVHGPAEKPPSTKA